MRLTRLLAAGTVAATLLTGAVVLQAPPAVAAVTDGAIFNNPTVAAEQYKIRDHIRSLIQGTPAGATIRVTIYHFTNTSVSDDLIAAKNRGVSVKVVVDRSHGGQAPVTALKSALGENRGAASWVHVCTDAACIGTKNTPIMHNKFFLFSSTGGASNVVVQASANLTTDNATKYWNNAVTLVGNANLYNGFAGYFDDLAYQRHTNDYYTTVSSGNAKAYYFPRAGTGPSTDTIYNALDENVTCQGNTSVGTETGRTIIRIGMWTFGREEIAQKLRELANQKCWVEVIYTEMYPAVRAALANHDRIVLYHVPDPWVIHSKYMLIEGTYAGQKDTKWVFTGSHNYTTSALRENDETLLRIKSAAIHDQFRANFRTIRAMAEAG